MTGVQTCALPICLEGLVLDVEDAGSGSIEVSNISIPNLERVVRFELGNDTYELTLSKKRKPKA